MKPILTYLFQTSICLAIFYTAFWCLMSRMKSYRLNRLTLLAILFISALLPVLNISILPEKKEIVPIQVLQELFVPANANIPMNVQAGEEVVVETSKFTTLNFIHLIYLAGLLTLIIFTSFSITKVFRMIQNANHIRLNKLLIAIVNHKIQPFTFMNRIVINRNDYEHNRDIILEHEKAHIQLGHALDLFILEIFTLLQWFNPFIWLFRREMKMIHEYQADEAVLNKGIDVHTYQLLVIKKAVGERRFALAIEFYQKPILKRLKMMQKKNKPKWAWLKLMLFVPLAAIMLQAFSRPDAIANMAYNALPSESVKDSTQKWLGLWTLENINRAENRLVPNKLNTFQTNDKDSDPKNEKFVVLKERNVFTILINKKNEFLVEGQRINMESVITESGNFINGNPVLHNPNNTQEFIEKDFNNLGKQKVYQGTFNIMFDIGTDRKVIDDLLKRIGEKYLAARQEKSKALFQKDYFDLDQEQRKIIDTVVPVMVTIAKPKKMSKPPPPPPPPPKTTPAK